MARLLIDNHLVTRSEGGFADPLPLVLFERGEHDAGGPHTDVASATRRLAALGATADHIDRFVRAIHRHAARAPQPLLRRPELGWAGLPAGALLRFETRRTATGFTAHPEHVLDTALAAALVDDPDDTRALRHQLDDARAALAVMGLACACLQAPDTATVHYDVSALVAQTDLETWLDELWQSRPDPDHLAASIAALVEGVDALATRIAHDADDDTEATARAIDTALAAGQRDRAAAMLTAALTSRLTRPGDPKLDAALDALVRAALEAGDPDAARAALTPWLFRDPATGVARLARLPLPHTGVVTALSDTLADAISLPRAPLGAADWQPQAWRADAVELAMTLVDAGHVPGGLALLAHASDADCTGGPDDPLRPLVTALRLELRNRYGLPHAHADAVRNARFLVTEGSAEISPVTDLSRLLHDALVGAIHEPQITDEARREAFFEAHVAPGLSWLEHDPTPAGGRQHLPRVRNDESGPGLGLALAFLLGLAGLITLIGYLLVTYAA